MNREDIRRIQEIYSQDFRFRRLTKRGCAVGATRRLNSRQKGRVVPPVTTDQTGWLTTAGPNHAMVPSSAMVVLGTGYTTLTLF